MSSESKFLTDMDNLGTKVNSSFDINEKSGGRHRSICNAIGEKNFCWFA